LSSSSVRRKTDSESRGPTKVHVWGLYTLCDVGLEKKEELPKKKKKEAGASASLFGETHDPTRRRATERE
jgi:hypothetical protein